MKIEIIEKIGLFFILLVLTGGVFYTAGTQNSIGTGALRTATGSTTCNGGVGGTMCNTTMNDYGFFPSITNQNTLTNGQKLGVMQTTADPNNTLARVQVESCGSSTCTEGTSGITTTRWRYITATDNPYWWIHYDITGKIVGTWISDDPPTVTFLGTPLQMIDRLTNRPFAGVQSKRIIVEDLQIVSFSSQDVHMAEQYIQQFRLSMKHRLYRALQKKAGDDAPSMWILEHMKVNPITGRLECRQVEC